MYLANQHNRANSFRWVCHENLPFIPNHLRHVYQCSTVIQMKVTTHNKNQQNAHIIIFYILS